MITFAFILIAYLCGSLPFSVWLGQLFLRRDVRRYGDGNPGAANVFRAGGRIIGILALLMDISKAAAPVGLAYNNLDIDGPGMFIIALAPIIGHIYSPFLNFKGGKAIAATLGVWIGLTIWKMSLPGIICALIGITLFVEPGWVVMLALAGILAALLIWLPDPLLLAVLFAQVVLLAWTHRADLQRFPNFRPWLMRLFSRFRV